VNYSTFSGNSASKGGAIFSDGPVVINNSTLANNSASVSGGATGSDSATAITISNSLVSGNSAPDGAGLYKALLSQNNAFYKNVDSGNSAEDDCNSCGASTDPIIGDTMLSALGNYGGPTQTILPLPGSVALCAANPSYIPAGYSTDQRGNLNFTTYGSTNCEDVGAVNTSYGLSFTTEPQQAVGTGVAMSPAPVLTVTESGSALTAGEAEVSLTDTASDLTTIPVPVSTSIGNGQAAFSSLIFTTVVSSDNLTAKLPITPTLNAIATSSGFAVATAAVLTSPTPGVSTVLGTSGVAFQWVGNTGTTAYQLYLGTTGVGSSNLFSSGTITASSVTVSSLPSTGVTVYARLLSEINGTWLSNDYVYTETGMPPAQLTSPTPGAVLGASQTFTWTTVTGVTEYQLWLGTAGVGTFDLYNSGAIPGTSATVFGIPSNGVVVYVRVFSKIGGAWQSVDYTFTETGTPAPATLITPTPGLAPVLGTSANFTWTTGTGVVEYQLWLGTTGVGSLDLYDSLATTATSKTVSGIPTNGITLYIRILSKINGVWQSVDYTYTETGVATPATLTAPTPGPSTLLGATPAFTWTAGTGVTAYQLWLGTTGVGTFDLYNSGSTTANSESLSGIPTNGVTVYVRLLSKINQAWQSVDYIYTETGTAARATLTAPAPATMLGANPTFIWTAGTGVSAYQLWLGTTGVGTFDLYNSGSTTATSKPLSGIPTSGVTVYVRLFSKINGLWEFVDYTYTETGTVALATLSSPTPGPTTVLGSSQTFNWTTGTGVTAYQLWLGTYGVGAFDLYDSGSTTATSASVPGIPANGVIVYVRLYSKINGVWQSNDYTYTESGTAAPATLSNPTPGPATVLGTSQAFNWTAGTGVTAYQLWLGTTGIGTFDLYNSGSTTVTSETVSGIPANGVIVYVRLYSKINGAWHSNDYTYTESGTATAAALTAPTLGTLLGSSQTFTWSSGTGVTSYQLWLGTTGVGSLNLYDSGSTTATTETVPGIPQSGATVYVRVFSKINGAWVPADYTFTEGN